MGLTTSRNHAGCLQDESKGINMYHEPAAEAIAATTTIASATPPPEEKPEIVRQNPDDPEARPWRGIYMVELPEQALFTKQIDVRPEQLEKWKPRGVTSDRQVPNDDE